MRSDILKNRAAAMLDNLEDIILQELESKGDTEQYCQKVEFVNRTQALRMVVNGITEEDMIERRKQHRRWSDIDIYESALLLSK